MTTLRRILRALLLSCLVVVTLGAGKPIKITLRNSSAKDVLLLYQHLSGEKLTIPAELQTAKHRVKELDVNTEDNEVAKAAIRAALERDAGIQIVRAPDGGLRAEPKK